MKITAKEKANELVDKMHNSEHCGIKHFPNKKYCECVEMNLFQAKQCALIAVDEILNVIDRDMNYQNVYSFYLDVKKEIELL